ncbi:PAS domain-containing sensor histidine kinase [Empedobacter falsenii]|uniref:PAS domain-containing sensor histidine kinase n=1 Tax=Empedobacter falsenii TaxID=343874 RepID=UPI0025767A74|nr:PAS domain-containing sensor histidine kinase [Empedobacter falsenii]MDM1547478.1 PAS domain-containing sensor histidine kinase [Empedobacter falsenii]
MKPLQSENHHQFLSTHFLDQNPLGFAYFSGNELLLSYANSNFYKFLGLQNSVIGNVAKSIFEKIQLLEIYSMITKVYHCNNSSKEMKVVGLKNEDNGQTDFLEIIVSSVISPDNNSVEGVSVVIKEIVEQDYNENTLENSITNFDYIVSNSLASTIVLTGIDPIIEVANQKMVEFLGKGNSLSGNRLFTVFPELETENFLKLYKKVYVDKVEQEEKEFKVDYFYNNILCSKFLHLLLRPKLNNNREVVAIIISLIDITDLIETREKLRKNENLLKAFLEHVPVSINVLEGENFEYKLSNSLTDQIWGHHVEIGSTVKDTVSYIKDRPIYKYLQSVFKTGEQIERKEHQFLDRDGNTKYVNYILQPIKDEENKVEYILTLGYDVSNEIEYKNKLEANEKRFKILADFMPQFVWTSDKDGVVTYFNRNWYEIFGLDDNIDLDKNFWSLLHPESLDKVRNSWMDAVRQNSTYEVEYQLVNPITNISKWYLARGKRVCNDNDETELWIGTCTDIDDFKQLQKQKDDFIGIASHELKTPLTSLKLYAQSVEINLRKQGDEKNAEVVKKMETQINKLNKLISDLLDVTKIQSGRMVLQDSIFLMEDLVAEIVEEQQMSTKTHTIILTKESAGCIRGDRDRIGQVLSNLINNAVKYSPKAKEVEVNLELIDGSAKVSIKDNGFGIPQNKIHQVFDQYFRVGSEYEQGINGLGLGLFICAEIINKSNGQIYVKSELHKGSTFCFELPILK